MTVSLGGVYDLLTYSSADNLGSKILIGLRTFLLNTGCIIWSSWRFFKQNCTTKVGAGDFEGDLKTV